MPGLPMNEVKEENLHKELDLIQAIVARMAQNAYYLKGWSISLVAVVLAIGKDDVLNEAQRPWLLALVLLIWLVFWYLDAWFLRQERLYRCLYNHVIRHKADPDRLRYSLNVDEFISETPGIWATMTSSTLLVFYGLPAAVLAGLLFYSLYFFN